MDKTALSTQLRDMFAAMDPGKGYNMEDWLVDYDTESGRGDAGKHRPAAPRASFRDDPLALSCASYRIYKNEPTRRFVNIDTVKATAEDRAHAQVIRDYYGARYTMKALRGHPLTDWQQKAAGFLSGLYYLTTEEIGMLYKLPYFYEEDLAMDEIIAKTVSTPAPSDRFAVEEQLTLVPLQRVLITRKGTADQVHYYYLDQNQHAVVLTCPATNSLNPMMEGLFRQPGIRVQGYVFFNDIGVNSQHYVKKPGRWELVF